MPPKAHIYSVKQLNNQISEIINQEGILKNVHVKGEIGTLNFWSYGIVYLNLKEGDQILSCMIPSAVVRGASFELKKGMTITIVGNIYASPKDSSFRLKATSLINDNEIGEAQKKLLLLKQELQEEGLFDPQYKRPIPKGIKTLGFVTSETGAVINDVISEVRRMDPSVQIVMVDCKVSGEEAVHGMVRGIKLLEDYGAELILLGRGGGSDEQLWVYNNREIAEAVFDCSVPIISCVGHDVNYTILDLVADGRASTPTQGASMAVTDYRETYEKLGVYEARLKSLMKSKLMLDRARLESLTNKLSGKSPALKIQKERSALKNLAQRLDSNMNSLINKKKHSLGIYIERFKGLSPLDKLNQGYSYVSVDGKTLRSIKQVNKEDELNIYLGDGIVNTKVTDIKSASIF